MDAQMSPGVNNYVMASMETLYLPRIPTSILQPISASQTTMVTLRPEAALDLPLAQQQFLTVEVQTDPISRIEGANCGPMRATVCPNTGL